MLVYGTLVEARLHPATYVAFYVAAGYASTAAQLGEYLGGGAGFGTLGASGAALGLVALFSTTTALDRTEGVPSPVESLFAVSGVVVATLVLANDFLAGVALASGTAPFGHVGGMLTGLLFGLVLVRARGQQRSGMAP